MSYNNYNNPTQLHIGQAGTYGGCAWSIVGRVVLGVLEDGEMYYWNEFNLETATGEVATLVFERTKRGSEWRWFTLFDPENPITAEDAATKEVGDILNLDGTYVRVSLLETSRIYFIEGRAPDGEKLDSVANYFNAENGEEMLVVSWTGPEVECYRGRTISEREVKEAFHLDRAERNIIPAGALTRHNWDPPAEASWTAFIPHVLLSCGIIILMIIVGRVILAPGRSWTSTGIKHFEAPMAPLKLGSSGRLTAVNYHITGRARVTVAEENLQFEQQQYFLRDDQNGEALLVAGFLPGRPDWLLFTPLNPAYPMTPYDAAAMKLGQLVHVAGVVAPVSELFFATVAEAEFTETPQIVTGETFYGFAGKRDPKRDSEFLLARWNVGTIRFWRGRVLSSQTVLAALNSSSHAK